MRDPHLDGTDNIPARTVRKGEDFEKEAQRPKVLVNYQKRFWRNYRAEPR